MKERKFVIAPIVIVLSLFLSYLVIGNPIVAFKNKQLQNSILALNKQQTRTVKIQDIVPFEWDSAYTFSPGTNREEIVKKVGINDKSIKEPKDTEQTLYLVFLKDNKIISIINQNVSDIGYNIIFSDYIKYSDKNYFEVQLDNDIIILKEIQ